MRIESLSLQNFRHFEVETFHFKQQVSVLIGDNGSGKTAILDALAIAASSLFLGIDQIKPRVIRRDDIRRVLFQTGDLPNLEPQPPTIITASGNVAGQQVTWERSLMSLDGNTRHANAAALKTIAYRIGRQIRENDASALLPLIVHYRTGRLWLQKKEKSADPLPPSSRSRGYIDAMEPATGEKLMRRWFKTMTMVAIQRRASLDTLDGVRRAVTAAIPEADNIFHDLAADELVVVNKETGAPIPFRLLSDGPRNMISMVADMAYRAAVLNPQLKEDAARETPGIVLIDEIDMHLHPTWQRRVLDDLRTIFPKLQIVATTHSPFIIQSLRPGELINLDQRREEYVDRGIEDIAERVMGVDDAGKSRRWHTRNAAAAEFLGELDNTPAQQLDERLLRIEEEFTDDPALTAFLKMKKLARQT